MFYKIFPCAAKKKKIKIQEPQFEQEEIHQQPEPQQNQVQNDSFISLSSIPLKPKVESACQSQRGGMRQYSPQEAQPARQESYSSIQRYISLNKMPSLDLKPNGLANSMFYCYMNAALQCLLCIGQLSAAYYLDKSLLKNRKTRKYTVAYYDLIAYIMEHTDKGFPVILHTKLQKLVEAHFSPFDQHDAHEFLLFLLSKLQEEATDQKESPTKAITFSSPKQALKYYCRENTHIVDQIFMGQLTTVINCSSCHKGSYQYDPFFDISVPIEPNCKNISDCLDLYFQDETLDDEWYCDQCKQKSKQCVKRVGISNNPNILVLQLKRFHVYPQREKLKNPIEIFYNLNLSNYTHESTTPGIYQLKSMIVHKGTVEGGHYIAIARKGNKWYYYDDEEVTTIQQSDAEQVVQAYVLFYEKL